MSSGPRSGQLVMKNAVERIAGARSLRFTQARTDWPLCVPMRASLMTGLTHMNHHMGGSFEASEYYETCRLGRKKPFYYASGGTTVWFGPWERDLALQAQIASGGWGAGGAVTVQSVPASSQGTVGGKTNSFRTSRLLRGDTDDDLQAFTGSLPVWLKHAGVTCGLFGKYQNKYGQEWNGGVSASSSPSWLTTITGGAAVNGSNAVFTQSINPNSVMSYVPPGWDEWHCFDGDPTTTIPTGSTGNAYAWRIAHYSGDNAADSDGQVADSIEVGYYAKTVTSITRSGTVATATVPGHGMLEPGEEFAMEGATDANFNGTTRTVASILDADRFTYTVANSGATTASGTITCYPRRGYADHQWTLLGRDFILSRAETEPWFLYYAPHNPHKAYDQYDASGDPTHASPTKEVERRYMSTVSGADLATWNGTPGAFSPTTDATTLTGTFRSEWERRQEMLASVDDTIGALLDACEARGWFNVTLILTSDNGYLEGEHTSGVNYENPSDAWDNGKGFIWEGCVRMPLWIRHPKWGRSGVSHLPVSAADLGLTVLDIFGEWPACSELATHHAHTNRDGVSLLRLLAAGVSDPLRARALLTRGRWRSTGSSDTNALAVITADLKKLIRDKDDTTLSGTHQLFDVRLEDDGAPAGGVPGNPDVGMYLDYEVTDLAADTATCTAMNARLEALKVGRWDPATSTNTYRTA